MSGGARFIAAAAVCLALFATASAASAATLPGVNGKIAFARGLGPMDPACDDDIHTINPDGTGEAAVTFGPDCDGGPAWHPDGRRLAFARGSGHQRISRLEVGPEVRSPPCGFAYPSFEADAMVVNADGSGIVAANPGGEYEAWPDWAPDGRGYLVRLADGFQPTQNECGSYRIEEQPFPPGTFRQGVRSTTGDDPAFSPAGDAAAATQFNVDNCCLPRDANIAIGHFAFEQGGPITSGPGWDYGASWSPDGSRIAFARAERTGPGEYAPADIYVANAETNGLTQLTSDPGDEDFPTWAPDGTKLAFSKCCFGSGTTEIFTMNADGSDQTRLTVNDVNDSDPSWQRTRADFTTHVRPKAANGLEFSLVPAYRECTAPNREHGPPLAFPSCASPVQRSGLLTVGTADSNGQPTKSEGTLRLKAIAGNAATASDEADVAIQVSITDVRYRSDLSDYTSDAYPDTLPLLAARFDIRMTDRSQQVYPAGANLPHTVQDFELPADILVPCSATADPTVGGTCAIDTTFDAVVPGAVVEQRRTTMQIDDVRIDDGGPDDNLETPGDNTVFAVPGIFVP